MASLRQRGSKFYVSYYVSGRERRKSLDTDSLQLAKEKLRQFESAQLRGDDNPLPTRTSIPEVVEAYVSHIRTMKTRDSIPLAYWPAVVEAAPGVGVSGVTYEVMTKIHLGLMPAPAETGA